MGFKIKFGSSGIKIKEKKHKKNVTKTQVSHHHSQPKTQVTTTTTTHQPVNGWYIYYYNMLSQQDLINLRLWFDSVDTDRGGTIEAHELANLSIDGTPLGIVLAIKLIKVFDRDRNGRIDFFEYCTLHKFLLTIRGAFVNADKDRSGTLTGAEIHQALVQSGFGYLSYPTVMELIAQFDPNRVGLAYHHYLLLAAQVAHARSLFEWNDTDRDGICQFNIDTFNYAAASLTN